MPSTLDPRSYRWLFLGWALALLALMLTVAPDFGATWDEPQQRAKALRLLAYLSGRTPALHEPIDGAHLYGAPFDIISAALEPLVPADPYVIRHEVIALVGWLCVLTTGLLADRLFGPPHGLLAMMLLSAWPTFFAHAMNNPKDMPFAAVATAVLLTLVATGSRPPWTSWRAMLVLTALIGLGLNVRAGALMFVGYLGAVAGYWLLRGPVTVRTIAQASTCVILVLAGAVAIGWIGWPWAYQHPLTAPFTALIELGHFGWPGTVLFDGLSYPGTAPPRDYVLRWFWLTLPPIVLAGIALSMLLLRNEGRRDQTVVIWAVIAFPILFVIGTRATLYDGVRHLLFVLPPLTILAAAGWIEAWRVARPAWRLLIVAATTAGVIEPVAFQCRNHPNQTAYIQPLAGGPKHAFARYDLDYWGNCLLQGLSYVNLHEPGDQVYVSGSPMLVLQADLSRFPRLVLAEPTDPRVTSFVTLARGTRAELLALAAAPNLEARISTADGALLCTVSPTDPRRPESTSRP